MPSKLKPVRPCIMYAVVNSGGHILPWTIRELRREAVAAWGGGDKRAYAEMGTRVVRVTITPDIEATNEQ